MTYRLVVLLVAVSCATPDRAAIDTLAGRDSSDVQIVTNVEPSWRPHEIWQVESDPIFSVDLSDDQPEQGPLEPVAVFRASAGEIVVADGGMAGWDRLLVYHADGSFARFVGRKGQGPCEFGQLWSADPYRGDSVAVFDMANSAIVVLGLDGGCGRKINLPQARLSREQRRAGLYVNGSYGPYADGSFLVYPQGYLDISGGEGPAPFKHTLLRLAPDGSSADTLGTFDISWQYWTGQRAEAMPYSSPTYHGLDGSDLIYGDGDSFEFARIDSVGAWKQIVRRIHTPQRLTEQDRIAFVTFRRSSAAVRAEHAPPQPPQTLEERVARYHWPEVKPAYSGLLVDTDGNVWIEQYRFFHPQEVPSDPPATVWSVFGREGHWLGDISVPGRFLLRRVYSDAVYGIWRNEDGTGGVRGYRLAKGQVDR